MAWFGIFIAPASHSSSVSGVRIATVPRRNKDFTFGVGESANGAARHPFWADAQHKNPNSNQWNILFDALHNNPRIRAMILRRTRSLMDRLRG